MYWTGVSGQCSTVSSVTADVCLTGTVVVVSSEGLSRGRAELCKEETLHHWNVGPPSLSLEKFSLLTGIFSIKLKPISSPHLPPLATIYH